MGRSLPQLLYLRFDQVQSILIDADHARQKRLLSYTRYIDEFKRAAVDVPYSVSVVAGILLGKILVVLDFILLPMPSSAVGSEVARRIEPGNMETPRRARGARGRCLFGAGENDGSLVLSRE